MKRSLNQAGYEVRNSKKETVKEIAAWGEIVILTVPFIAMDNVVSKLGDSIDKKVVVDPTNALTADMQLALGFSTSGAEEPQKKMSTLPPYNART